MPSGKIRIIIAQVSCVFNLFHRRLFSGELTHLRIRLLRYPGIEDADETMKLPLRRMRKFNRGIDAHVLKKESTDKNPRSPFRLSKGISFDSCFFVLLLADISQTAEEG